ncbi:hypothetical protein KML001_34660 [Klebsiella quasipneumoniae subsp. similipneumoniae]|nr:hypothetical protein KML001_34660 [Klebsiella quasipneumoniae subsp. similipneumoniae]
MDAITKYITREARMINSFILEELFDEINKYEKATREAKWKQDAKIIIKVNLNLLPRS